MGDRPHKIRNLFSRKILFVFAGLLVMTGLGVAMRSALSIDEPAFCSKNPFTGDGDRTIDNINPTSGAVGEPDVSINITGCNIKSSDTFKLIFDSPPYELTGLYVIELGNVVYPDRPTMEVHFDLSAASLGLHDVKIEYVKLLDGPGSVTEVDGYLVYSPAIVGWGWFGASPSANQAATPAWLSLNCESEVYTGRPAGTCASEGGFDYGLGLFYVTDHHEIRGSAWFGETSDNDADSGNDATLGWVSFDAPGPYPDPSLIPGTASTWAEYDQVSGRVSGWARSSLLQSYGASASCTDFIRNTAGDIFVTGSLRADPFAVDEAPNGSLHAVWRNTLTQKIYYTNFIDGSWIGTTLNLSDAFGTTNDNTPDIVVDANSVLHLGYIGNTSDIIQYAQCDFGGGADCLQAVNWVAGTDINPVGISPINDMRIDADSFSDPFVLYSGQNLGDSDVYLTYSTDNGVSWSIPDPVSSSGVASQPDFEIDHDDVRHVVWKDTAANQDIYYRKYDGGWDSPYQVSQSVTDNSNPRVAADSGEGVGGGQPHIVYDSNRSGVNQIYYTRYTEVDGWQPEQQRSSGGGNATPAIDIGSNGIIHVMSENESTDDIEYIESTNGRDWTDPILATALTNPSVPEVIASPDGTVQAVYINTPGLTRIYHTRLSDRVGQSCDPNWGQDWGWVSLRGGTVELDDIGPDGTRYGPMRSCYDCTDTQSCRICEFDDFDYDDDDPAVYSCNTCSRCGICNGGADDGEACSVDIDCTGGGTCEENKKCRRTGESCVSDNDCPILGGVVNECTPVCDQCNTCDLWGLSIEGPPDSDGRFHGNAWSAGGTIPVDSGLPAGNYDSGVVEIESDITDATDDPICDIGPCQCATTGLCAAWGWQYEQANSNVTCLNTDQIIVTYPAINSGDVSGWGVCKVHGTQNFSKLVPITSAGNYFISLSAIFDQANLEDFSVTVVDGATGEDRVTLTGEDLGNPNPAEVLSCTFTEQVYIEPGDELRFENTTDVRIDIDAFRVTTLPVYGTPCFDDAVGPPPPDSLTTVFVDEVGYGFTDFSQVSLVTPWAQTQYGNVYSGGSIGPGGRAPGSQYNSTYIIETSETSGGTISWTVNPVSGTLRET
ncbi:MAG: hypothetical protein Q8Q20_00760, partial [bacterium]|nr:hypothetical protein [bacterium]